MAISWRKDYIRYKTHFFNILDEYKQKEDLKMFTEILLSLATISLFGVFALKPTFVTIAQLSKDIKTKEETISKMDVKINNLQRAQVILTEEATKISNLKIAISDSPEPDILIRQIEGITAKNSVSVLGISIDALNLKGNKEVNNSTSSEKINLLPNQAMGVNFSISAGGNYSSLLSFVQDFENLIIPIKFDSLGFNISKSQDGNALTVAFSGKKPYLGGEIK